MVVIKVFSECIEINYKSTLLSKASFFSLVTCIVSLLVPYFIAFHTEGFWLDKIIFYEQPKVDFSGEYLFVALTNNQSHPIVCSTLHRDHMNDLDDCVFFMFQEPDKNYDGYSDQLDLRVEINLDRLKIISLELILAINYEIMTICPIKMQSAIIVQQYFHQRFVSDINIMADLYFFQISALHCDEKHNSFYNTPILGNEREHRQFQIENIIESYSKRNLTTHLTNMYTQMKYETKDTFTLMLSVRYPEQKIYYIPKFWQKIKHAWIQYLAIFTVVTWILNKVCGYMYHQKWILCYRESPAKKGL